jgi:O-antigen biosynthesis protein
MLDNARMERLDEKLHTYNRIAQGEGEDSLALIAKKIQTHSVVLDLGMGAGMLGQLLKPLQSVQVDGVTHNADEKDIGKAWYRQVHVLNLDSADALRGFADASYDVIVCADVLEHLKLPERVLQDCKRLLKPQGRLLVSVPNVGYTGLIAELLQGEFRYREEGLLDSTHLRFFTKSSLARFFAQNGWALAQADATHRNLSESEFKAAYDALPPAVARHLLALPDALCYQFIWELQVHASADVREQSFAKLGEPMPTKAEALFSAQLYLKYAGAYHEDGKVVCAGIVGADRQTLTFPIAPRADQYECMRLDPADRPGFFRVYALTVANAAGAPLWRWAVDEHGMDVFGKVASQQMALAGMSHTFAGSLWMLHGDDPWLELPLPAAVLQALSAQGGSLQVLASWPMSADYLQATSIMAVQHNHLSMANQALSETTREKDLLQAQSEQRQARLLQSEADAALAHAKNQSLEAEQRALAQAHNELTQENHAHKAQVAELGSVRLAMQHEKKNLVHELHGAQRDSVRYQQQFEQVAAHLQKIERSRLFRYTRPLSHVKAWIDQNLFGEAPPAAESPKQHVVALEWIRPAEPVDIIVPVYKSLADTQKCLESVLAAQYSLQWHLVVINDCSPEPELSAWLREWAQGDARITLLENPENLGFVATVNRGMALHPRRHVVLLNSDTEVANDWLDKLVRCAVSNPRVGTVTPFSNNATIFSYPQFCAVNDLPEGYGTQQLDALFAAHFGGQSLEVPTGMGFCMLITRACLDRVGYFDVENFGKGYGEENDFCVRAQQLGWKNLHALDTFVRHFGGVSFGDSKSEREIQAMNTLRRMHPAYEPQVHAFVARDPASMVRMTVDLARIVNRGLPVILNVLHDREGGTLRHVQELAAYFAGRAVFLRLTPLVGGVGLVLEGRGEVFSLTFELPSQWDVLLAVLTQLGVQHVHYHHVLGYADQVLQLADYLGVPHDFTAHDFYSFCPQISLTDATDRYCGEQGVQQCKTCLVANPAPMQATITDWRSKHGKLLARARYVIAPSEDTAKRMQRFVPAAHVVVASHNTLIGCSDAGGPPVVPPRALGPHDTLRIVVLGALSKIKGADILEDVASLAAQKGLPLDFHLLGFGYRQLKQTPKTRLTVHGKYDDAELATLLADVQPDLIWFPAVWPETFSYTLSAALHSSVPIVVPNLGAFGERLVGRPWSWECDWALSASAWMDFFEQIRVENFVPGSPPAVSSTRKPADAASLGGFAYETSYLASLDKPQALDACDLNTVAQWIEIHSNPRNGALSAKQGAKGFALRVVNRLRALRMFSALVRMIPAHRQRRIKSWLSR